MVKLKNTTTSDITIAELIERITTLSPSQEITLDPDTRVIEVRP